MDETAPIAKRAVPLEEALARANAFVEASRPECAVEKSLARAHSFLALVHGDDELDKSLWGSPAGKRHLAKRIVAAIPSHRVYVEPFAGGAQVFWAKEPAEIEVLADRDPDIAFAFRFVKGLTAKKLARLKRKSWVGDAERFRKLYESEPEDDVDRFHRFAYLALFSFNKLRRGTMPEKNVGVESRFIERLENFAPRLKDVTVRCADYENIVDEFDGPETFFFLDPPYPGYEAEVGHDEWDESRFGKVLRRIDGKFLVTYGTRSEGAGELFKGFHLARWRHTSGVGAHQGQGLRKSVTLVATNYRIRKEGVAPAEDERERQLALPAIAPPEPVDKTIWGSPAGKKRLAARLVKLVPAHRVYVEPFAGSAAVFFEKEPAEVEVLGDADPEIAFAFKAIKSLTDDEFEALRRKNWTGSERVFKALLDARPRSKVEKLYRFLYLAHFSYGKLRGKSFNPGAAGVEARTIDRIEAFRDRLRPAKVRHAHYAELVKEFDSPDTFFYLDPPYPGHNVEIGEDTFDEAEFRNVLDGIKGKFLVTYGTRGELDTKGFHVRKIRPPRSIRSMRGVGGPKTLPTLLIANYAITEKSLGGGWGLDEVLEVIDVEGDAGDALEMVKARLDKLAIDEIHPDRLHDVPDEEILSVHRRLHQLFGGNFAGTDHLTAGGLRREDLVNAEVFVEDEMERRGMEHQVDDELAREAEALRRTAKRELAPTHASGDVRGREITLEEVLPHFQSFKLRAPFLYLVGGLANNGRTQNDIDVLVRGRLPDEVRRVIEFRLGRMLPPDLSSRLQLLDDEYAGPFTSHVELADLVVEVRPTLDVKRMRLVDKQDDPLLDLPKERGPRPAVLQYHFRGKSVHGDLRLRIDDHLVGWTLSLQRPGAIAGPVDTVEEARRIARSFSVDGGRYTKPLVAPAKVFATPKARQPVVWLDIDGDVFGEGEVGATANEKGVIVAIDHPRVEWGLQKPFSHEYFFSRGRELAGVMHFRLLTGEPGEPDEEVDAGRRTLGGEPFWTAFLSKELLPSVLKPRAVETRSMPPDGYSAIPVSLEQVTPKELRYWEATGDEARDMRDALVESGFFTADNIRLVDGEFRRVVQKLFVFDAPAPDVEDVEKAKKVPFNQWGGSAKYAKKLAERLPDHDHYVEPFCGSAALFFAKEPADEEVLADADADVVFAHRYLQRLDKRSFAALKRFPWKVTRTGFKRARECEPRSDAERFWKLVYGRQCAWGGKSNMSGFSTIHDGQTYDIEELWRFHERLKGARLVTKDWKDTLAECDRSGTLFFIDPPYVEEWDMENGIPPEDIAAEVAKLKGDYVLAYTDSARARRALRKVGRPFKMRFLEARHAGLWKTRSRLFVASCKLKKIDDVEWLDDDAIDIDKQREVDFTLSWQFWKGQTVVRAAPSRQVWHLVLDRPGAGLDTWVLQADPLSGEERITAVHTPRGSKDLLAFDGDVPPGEHVGGEVLNDTKNTPSAIRLQDRGRAVLLDDQTTFKKVRFEGGKLRGVFTLTAEEAGSDIWQLARGHDPGRAVAKAREVRDLELADGTVVEGVQVWDPAKTGAADDRAGDRAKLAPLALFKPMKVPARATNEFRRIDETAAFATQDALRAGILVDPKYNGFRFVVEKDARGRVLMFTEEVFDRATPLQNYARLLPGVATEIESLPGPFVLDAEFLAFEGASPRPRRELAEFRGTEPVDDAGVRLFVFRALYLPDAGNLTQQPEAENRRALEAFLGGLKLQHLAVAPHRIVHTEAAMREAVRWAAEQPGSEGAMLKLAHATYSLGGENDAWAKLKLAREVRAIVYDRHPVKDSPGVYNFFGAVGPIPPGEADRWKETVEVDGKLYAPVGKTFNARLDAKVGDVIRVEATELLIDRSGGNQSITWFTPVVVDVTEQAPMTTAEVLALAQPEEFKKVLANVLAKAIPILKTGEERYVLGIVLEPETVDAQKDIYSAAEIREAAHRFMEEYRNVGLMHRELVNQRVKILESYLAPAEFELDGTRVKKGTWLLAVRVVDDDLWRQVKAGDLAGFSIGGSAVKVPVRA